MQSYPEKLDIVFNFLENTAWVSLDMLGKTLLQLHRVPCKDHPITGLEIVYPNDPEARVIKQVVVRGQHIKVHQSAFYFLVC